MNSIVVANWKQNKTLNQVESWLEMFSTFLGENSLENVEIVVAPSFPYLNVVSQFAKGFENISVAAQNASLFEKGAHTGQVGAEQLKDFAKYCIVGHSETGLALDKSVQVALKCCAVNLVPIFCLTSPPAELPKCPGKAVFAIEDPANISKEGVYSPKSSTDLEPLVKDFQAVLPSDDLILYGGSVNPANALEIAAISGISGALVGNASLDPTTFFEICQAFNAAS